MPVTFDPPKMKKALKDRGIDFNDAVEVFDGDTLDFEDMRHDYGEHRFVCIGYLHERLVVIVWTPRGHDRHVISMRKANDREQRKYQERFG